MTENQSLRGQPGPAGLANVCCGDGWGIVGNSPVLKAALRRAALAAETSMPVLITGESGTGKELFARFVHDHSHRRNGPLVVVNCAGFPRDLIDSALFGHERGAFTGARDSHAGCFEAASGGTLVLDEVGELPLDLQPKLLRILEEGRVTRLGARHPLSVDARIVAATNRNLSVQAARGAFRLDLYHRLSGITLALPPLRQRIADMPLLVEHFCAGSAALNAQPPHRPLSPYALASLSMHSWPGNLRELRHLIWRTLALAGTPLDEDHLLAELAGLQTESGQGEASSWLRVAEPGHRYEPHDEKSDGSTPSVGYTQIQENDPTWLCLQGRSWAEVEAAVIRHHLQAAGGNRRRAAATLGISRTTLYDRLRKLAA